MRRTFAFLTACLLMFTATAGASDLLIQNASVHTMGKDGSLDATDVLVRDGKSEIEHFPAAFEL